MVRSYDSAVRREQADRTRLALLEACEALLLEESLEDVTLPRIAKRAGVTAPTAYRYFPDQDALMSAFMERLRHRIGMGTNAIAAAVPESVHEIPVGNYASYERDGRLLRAVMMSPAYERVRLARPVDRAGMALSAWARERGGIPDPQLREMLGALYLLVTPAAWRWLRDTWGLDGEAAARAASWAVRALADAITAEGTRTAPSKQPPSKRPPAEKPPGKKQTPPAKKDVAAPRANERKARRASGKKEAR